ncbi:MAG: acetyl/propionyl/methylcrotonyl-CoA carboxylase subunit alpha [Pseudomonadota bacterium]
MFKKILIANRGEIACRILATTKRLGIPTVAVFSDADRDSRHVELADEAVFLGPPPAAESYLLIDKIVAACQETGADAVHPGFGFLSENAKFVKALDEAGIAFIGPPTEAIRIMGDKIESKKLADSAGVSTVPGHMGLIEDPEEAVKIAKEIGYPVMIKAAAGGGGKGMRVAADDEEAREGFRAARSEAKSSFADERVFIEKFIERPRHIEIQVLGDRHGTTLHLGERECSIQRRHQKVVEEAPSPFLDAETRAAMGAQAVALGQAVDYHSAGTVEFIVDVNKNFYFLEMNTRIQVEHPVTEMITGLDIVEWMIRIAAGEKLDFGQGDVALNGWAVESRVYAEDPARSFLPSVGRLVRYREPGTAEEGSDLQVRCDSGVDEGDEISIYYDPMIAKLVVHGPDRTAAIDGMSQALDAFHIRGVKHNLSFLTAIMANQQFRSGDISTNFVAEEFPDGYQPTEPAEAVKSRLLAAAVVLQTLRAAREAEIDGQLSAGQANGLGDWVALLNGEHHPLSIGRAGGAFSLEQDGKHMEIEAQWRPGDPLLRLVIDGQALVVQVERRGPAWRLSQGGAELEILVLARRTAELAARMPFKEPPDRSKFLLSPMPGLLVSLSVAEDQDVKAGEALAVVEAMKMENVLRAERDGVVAKIHAEVGGSLAVDQVILEFA